MLFISYIPCPCSVSLPKNILYFITIKVLTGPNREEVIRSWRKFTLRSFIICNHLQILFGDQIVEYDMSRSCDKCNEYHIYIRRFDGENQMIPMGRRRNWWKDNIRMDISDVGYKVFGLICLTQYRPKWWDVLNTGLVKRG